VPRLLDAKTTTTRRTARTVALRSADIGCTFLQRLCDYAQSPHLLVDCTPCGKGLSPAIVQNDRHVLLV
jgi:hypothetical protein